MSSRSEREARRARKQERLNRDAENQGASFGAMTLSRAGYQFDFHKIEKSGWQRIMIIPYIIGSDQHPEVRSGNMEIGDEDYFLQYAIHRNIGPDGQSSVICLHRTFGLPCYICEQAQEMKDAGDDNPPWPSRRALYNLIDMDGSSKIEVWDVSEKLFHDELKGKMLRSERGMFDFSDPETGSIIKFYATETQRGRFKYFEYKDFEFEDRDPFDEELIDQAIPLDKLLNIPTYEQVRDLFEGKITTIQFSSSHTTPEERIDDDGDDEFVDDDPDEAPVESKSAGPETDENGDDIEPDETPQTRTRLRYGDKCPLGLVFGKDFESNRTKCGLECEDAVYGRCEKAHDTHKE